MARNSTFFLEENVIEMHDTLPQLEPQQEGDMFSYNDFCYQTRSLKNYGD